MSKVPAPTLEMYVTGLAMGVAPTPDQKAGVAVRWQSGNFSCVTIFPTELVDQICEGMRATRDEADKQNDGRIVIANEQDVGKANGMRETERRLKEGP